MAVFQLIYLVFLVETVSLHHDVTNEFMTVPFIAFQVTAVFRLLKEWRLCGIQSVKELGGRTGCDVEVSTANVVFVRSIYIAPL